MADDDSPKEESKECWWNNDTFNPKQDSQLLNGHDGEASLNKPVQEQAEQSSRIDACICGKMVRKVNKAWPDSLKAPLQECTSLNSENSSPHQCNESSDANGRE
jgi:hypothetical protein